MPGEDSRVDDIVGELLERRLPKEQRIELLRELVARGADLPDEMLAEALQRLMQDLTE